jgi:hypothetical protein
MEKSRLKKQIERRLVGKALQDDTFRRLLYNNPRLAIELETGVYIPPSLKIKLLEEEPQTIYVVVPAKSLQQNEYEKTGTRLLDIPEGISNFDLMKV